MSHLTKKPLVILTKDVSFKYPTWLEPIGHFFVELDWMSILTNS